MMTIKEICECIRGQIHRDSVVYDALWVASLKWGFFPGIEEELQERDEELTQLEDELYEIDKLMELKGQS